MKIALVCIAKDEDNYIQEWIEYHLKLGFDNIFIYANDWEYNTKDRRVHVYRLNGNRQQLTAYNNCKTTFSNMFNWMAFLDVDEFLVLHKHENIKDFLNDYRECNAIGINWAMFGSNNHEIVINNNFSVLNRFTKRAKKFYTKQDLQPNKHIKSIVQLPCNKFQDIHCVHGNWYNTNKEIRSGPFNEPIDWSIAQVNHYFTKSREEFLIKCKRVRADNGENRNFDEYKTYLDINEEEDYTARNFFNASNSL